MQVRIFITAAAAMALAAAGRAQAVDIRSITPAVHLAVPASAFDPVSGLASVTSPAAIGARLRSNRDWSFTVSAGSPVFAHSPAPGAPASSKSVSDLWIRESGAGSFVPLSTGSVVIATGPRGNNIDRDFDLRLDASLDDPPGDYAATLVFTLFTQ